jgi:hypothetical protein
MGICRIDPRFGLALVLLSAVCVAGTRKAEPGQKGGQTQGGQAQPPPQGPPPRPTPSKPPNRPQPGHTRYYRRNLGYINRGTWSTCWISVAKAFLVAGQATKITNFECW